MMQVKQYVFGWMTDPGNPQPLVVPLGSELQSVIRRGNEIVALVLVNTDETQTEQWETQIVETDQNTVDIHQFSYWATIDDIQKVWHVWAKA